MAHAEPLRDPEDERSGDAGALAALADRAARTWTNALLRAGSWADRVDAVVPRAEPSPVGDPGSDDPASDAPAVDGPAAEPGATDDGTDPDAEVDPAAGLEPEELLVDG